MNRIGIADYGMTVWDGGCFSLERRLDRLKSGGFDGIEVLNASDAADAVRKAALLRRKGMSFLTCSVGGAPETVFEAASALGCSYVWLNCGRCTRDVPFDVWIRRAKNFAVCAADWGLKAALHNHLGSVIERQQELERFMEEVPEALLLLDIGHLAAAGGDNAAVVRRYHDRLAAIHLKDVRIKDASIPPDAENWWDRLEFCEIGGGNIGLDFDSIFSALKACNYNQWLLIEQDTHKKEPVSELIISRNQIERFRMSAK